MVKPEVVKHHYARMQSGDLPDRTVKQRIVSNLVKTGIGPIEFHPGHAIEPKRAHLNKSFQGRIPVALVSPEGDFGELRERRQNTSGVVRDISPGRGYWRKPIQLHRVTQTVSW